MKKALSLSYLRVPMIIYQCPLSIAVLFPQWSILLAYCIPTKSLHFFKFNHLSPQRFRQVALILSAYYSKQALN